MRYHQRKHRSGFTLVELAIVLGVVGVLFGGLWKLISAGNQQMRDQATANQHAQLIGSITTYLQGPEGLSYMAKIVADGNVQLALPSSATNAAGQGGCENDANMISFVQGGVTFPTHKGLCGTLPPGFWAGTLNPYGQGYLIRIRKDSTPFDTAPKTFSFMIVTTGSDPIPDISGGRISSMTGGDGGFIYSTTVCGATPDNACGAYGLWSTTPVATYGFTAGQIVTGHIASRSFYTPSQSLSDYWLARKPVSGDAAFAYNTMTTALYMGGQWINFRNSAGAAPSGVMNVQGGTINMNLDGATTGGNPLGAINMQGGLLALGSNSQITGISAATPLGGGSISLSGYMGIGDCVVNAAGTACSTGTASLANAVLSVTNGGTCSQKIPGDTTCKAVVQVIGDMSVSNLLTVNSLYATTFIYKSSDERLKANIEDLQNPLSKLMKLRPVSFTYRTNGKPSMGLIAQDLEKVYPQVVVETPNKMKAVEYEALIGPLVGAVQQLKKENDELRTQVDMLMRERGK